MIDVRGWWSHALVGNSATLGDELEYRHGEVHYSRQRLIKVIHKSVTWLTLDGNLTFVEKTNEWNGTIVEFEIADQGKKKLTLRIAV